MVVLCFNIDYIVVIGYFPIQARNHYQPILGAACISGPWFNQVASGNTPGGANNIMFPHKCNDGNSLNILIL